MTAKKDMRSTFFGEIKVGTKFIFAGDYLQRGMFDNPKNPMVHVKVSPRMYIEARMLEKGKIPKDRLKDIARKTTTNHLVIISPKGDL